MNKIELDYLKEMIIRRDTNLDDLEELQNLKYDLWDYFWSSMIERGYELPKGDSDNWYTIVSKLKGSRGATA